MMKVLLGITGSIAAYKAPFLIRELQAQGYQVKVVLTQAAKSFVTPLTLQALTGEAPHEDLMDPVAESTIGHIGLARWAERIVIAPASANFIAKLNCGFADDLLTTLCLASTSPILLAPAMNQQMWLNQTTQENIASLLKKGVHLLGPVEGLQACREEGPGRMLEPHDIVEQLALLNREKLLKGKRVIITAGPTREAIDPVRYISNRSSGKMGYALAKAALAEGAIVTLVSGPVALASPTGCHLISVTTAEEMLCAVNKNILNQDLFISTAAVSDYYCADPSPQKIKKTAAAFTLTLDSTVDILGAVRKTNPSLFMVGFSAETENCLAHAKDKLIKKEIDLIVVNDVSRCDIGFESDENAVTIISKEKAIDLPKASKDKIAQQILEHLHQTLT